MANIDGVQPVVCAQKTCDGSVSPHPSHSESRVRPAYRSALGASSKQHRHRRMEKGEKTYFGYRTSQREGAALPAAADAQTERVTAKITGRASDQIRAHSRDTADPELPRYVGPGCAASRQKERARIDDCVCAEGRASARSQSRPTPDVITLPALRLLWPGLPLLDPAPFTTARGQG